jgi:L-glyceraldehyde 3-phosphate reductase
MGLDYVDIFYHHRPDPETPLEETMGALDAIVRSGKALYVGISSYKAEDTAKAAHILKRMGTPCLIHQPSYSMLNRWIEGGLQDVLDEEGMGSAVFCPLAQGLLTDRYLKGIPEDSRAVREGSLKTRQVDEGVIAKVRALNEIAKGRGQTMAQMALAWCLRGGRVTTVLVGASRVSQLTENVNCIKRLDFTADELAAIDTILG